jgi:AcrR family transcriptional regulator
MRKTRGAAWSFNAISRPGPEMAMATVADATRFELQRDRMLRAAASCFNQKGYSGTSLKDVARQLGLTDAALYYYVKNKEELVYQCYLRAAELGRAAMECARETGGDGFTQAASYIRYHVATIVGDAGPVAIMSEIPSLKTAHRNDILAISRRHSLAFEEILSNGIKDGSIAPCDVRMTGNAIMGAINWIPKWFHGDAATAKQVVDKFPDILTRGLQIVSG